MKNDVLQLTFTQRAPTAKVLKSLRAPKIVIGKRPECDLQLSGQYGISPTHATLSWRDGRLWIEDEMTAGGTRVDGQRVEPKRALEVHDGSELQLGECVLTISFSA